MDPTLRILILEDVPADAALEVRELRKAGLRVEHRVVETREDFTAALGEFAPDLILSDYKLPAFDGLAALSIALERAPHVPFIMVTGSMSEETAVECIKTGAADYVIKENIARLAPAVAGALEKAKLSRDRAAAQAALRAREAKYRAVTETSPDGFWMADMEGRLLEVNEAYARRSGYSREELLGMRLADLEVQENPGETAAHIRAIAAKGDDRFESLHRAKDGEVWPVEITVAVWPIEGGRIFGFGRDITERKRADEELRRSEANYRNLFESANDAIVIFEPDSEAILDCNAEACRIYGYARDELVGMSLKTLTKDVPRGEGTVRKVVGEGSIRGLESVHLGRDGREINFLINASLIVYKGRPAVLSMNRDMTLRKRAEEDLRRSKQIIEGILDAIPVRVFWKDRNLVYLGCNSTFAHDAGFVNPDDVVGKDDFQMGWRDQAELYRDDDRQVIESGCAKLLIEEPQTTPEGTTITLLTSKLPLRDSNGDVSGVLGTYLDITERKRAEEALRESEARYRSLFDQSPLGIYQTTPDGRILAANPALLQKLGYASIEELTSRNLEREGYEPRYPRSEFKDRLEREGEVIGFESAWLKKDGEVLDVRESARVVRGRDGRTLVYEGTVEDVTAQRRAEEERQRLVAAVEQASESIAITDTEGRIEYVNPAFERITGYTREESIGQRASMQKSGEHDDAFYAAMWQAITRGETWQGHFVNRRKDGGRYEEEATISPIRDSRGTIVNFVAVKRDVTQEMALQTQLNQAQKMEAVGLLAGGVAHDFNNLLQAMLNHIELVRGERVDAAQMAATMAELEAEIRRGSSLTRQLLLFSRRETAKAELLDLNEVVASAAEFLRRLIRANIAVGLELADEPLPVTADRGQIDQVLMNLALNAADAMPAGGRLTIRSGREGQEWVWFAAEDTGTGIPVEIRDRIFEPFFTTKGKERGTGLGLSVVHGIVTQHRGEVELRDVAGGGASFHVRLPRAGAGRSPEIVPPAADPASAPGGHGERVLVVEDEEGARRGLVEILRMLSYDVVAVASGEEAGLLPREPGFDVLLTDLMLPGIAGSELARGLLERWPELKVILMSGYTEDEAVRRGAFAGRVRFLQKPFDVNTLAREVRAALEE